MWIPIMWYIVLSNNENDVASTPFTYHQYLEMKINFHSRVLGRWVGPMETAQF